MYSFYCLLHYYSRLDKAAEEYAKEKIEIRFAERKNRKIGRESTREEEILVS